MRLTIDHRTRYRFDRPQTRLVQLLRMTPEDTHDQTVAAWRIDVDCDARLRTARDGFGNIVTMLYADGPIDGIEIAVTGEVLTSETPGVLKGALDPMPPAGVLPRDADDGGRCGAARSSRATRRLALGPLEALHALNVALNRRFRILNRRGDPARSAAEAFAGEGRQSARSGADDGRVRAGARCAGAVRDRLLPVGVRRCDRGRRRTAGRRRMSTGSAGCRSTRASGCRPTRITCGSRSGWMRLARRRWRDRGWGRATRKWKRRSACGASRNEALRPGRPRPSAAGRASPRVLRPISRRPALGAEHLDRAELGLVRHPGRALHPIAEIDIVQPDRARAQDVVHDDEGAEARARRRRRRRRSCRSSTARRPAGRSGRRRSACRGRRPPSARDIRPRTN